MKKLFLLFAASALILSVSAQKPNLQSTSKKADSRVEKTNLHEAAGSYSLKQLKPTGSKSIAPVAVGTSGNLYSMYHVDANPMSYNEQFNVISFARRGGPTNGTGSQIFNSISYDNGTTWDTTNMVFNSPSYVGRFPNSGFYNPTANTDINNLYTLTAGLALAPNPAAPAPPTNYDGTFITWQKKGSPAKSYVHPNTSFKCSNYNYFQVCEDGRFYISGEQHDDDGQYLIGHPTFSFLGGTLDAATDNVKDIVSHVFEAPTLSHLIDGKTYYYNNWHGAGVAFNKAGTVGYFVTIGVRGDLDGISDTNISYRPIVYKTIDQGTTWNIMADFDFGTIPNLKEMLPGTKADTSIIVPMYDEITDLLVDANDNLHILSYIDGGSTSTTDSIGYSWTYSSIQGIMYDTYMTTTGWDATPLAYQYSTNTVPGANQFANECRLQGALSADGKKIFYSWSDTDTEINDEVNALPELYIASRHIDSTFAISNLINATTGTSLDYQATFHTMAPQVKTNGIEYTAYTIITQAGAKNIDPVKYWFLKDAITYVSVNNYDNNIANVSNLYPNPTNGLTNMDLTLINSSNVSIQVVNMMGQVVSSQDCGYKTTGMHKLAIDASDLTSGIYFVTVKAANSTITSKMIVR